MRRHKVGGLIGSGGPAQSGRAGTYAWCLAIVTAAVVVTASGGCLPKRLDRDIRPRPLADAVTSVTDAYQGVDSLAGQITMRALVEGEAYYAQGLLWYRRPDSLRIRLTAPLGATVGDVLTSRGVVCIALPATGKAFVGPVTGSKEPPLDALMIQLQYADYQDREGVRIPTRIYGAVEPFGLRFDVKLKTFEINRPVPAGVFGSVPPGYEYLPLRAVWPFLGGTGEKTQP